MAEKHPALLRTQVEIAAACGVAERNIAAVLGVARTTQFRWLKADGKERARVHKNKWQKKNPEAKARWNKKWRESNPEAVRENNRKSYIRHYQENREYYIAKANIRRNKMHKWPCSEIEKLLIRYRYEDARQLTNEAGVEHHVDHIWPLSRGGPHLPWNLRVVTKTENLSKGAKLLNR
jgi:5-methylcytosine-specific restriction endonuclease McrA